MSAMRSLALAGCLLACAEWRLPPTFPEQAAGRPVIHEQAVVGFSDLGDLAAAQLVDADGQEPSLSLLAFSRGGEPTRTLLEAPRDRAAAIAQRLRADGAEARPLLATLLGAQWPEALAAAAVLGFTPHPPLPAGAGQSEWRAIGAPQAGPPPLLLPTPRSTRPGQATAPSLPRCAPAFPGQPVRIPLVARCLR